MDTDEALSTTRAVRRRLDLTRPVERDVVEECLRLAFQAPNGANSQDWGWVLVDDPELRAQMQAIYVGGHLDHQKALSGAARPRFFDADSTDRLERRHASVRYLRDHFAEVPIIAVPCIGPRYGRDTTFEQASLWGSLLPAVWSFMLALRSRGLGSAWTTLHLYREAEMAALLGIPEDYTQAGMFPVAYTLGTDFKPAPRTRAAERVGWNRFPDLDEAD